MLFNTIFSLLIVLSPAAHAAEPEAGVCGKALVDTADFDFAHPRDWQIFKERFALIEARAKEQKLDGIEQRVLTSENIDIDIGLVTQKQRAADHEILSRHWRIPFSDTPDRLVRFTIKSEAALNAFIEFVIRGYFPDDDLDNPSEKFLEAVGAPTLQVIINGWPYARKIHLKYVGITRSKLFRFARAYFGVSLPAPRDSVKLMMNGSDNSHWDLVDAATFRRFILSANPASLHDLHLMEAWQAEYLLEHYGLDPKPLDTYFNDVARRITAQLMSLLGIRVEPFLHQIVLLKGFPETRDRVAPHFVPIAVEALKKLIEYGYVYVEPSRRECSRRWSKGTRPCGWITRSEFEREWPYSTANDEWVRPEWHNYRGDSVPVILSSAIEFAKNLP